MQPGGGLGGVAGAVVVVDGDLVSMVSIVVAAFDQQLAATRGASYMLTWCALALAVSSEIVQKWIC